MDFRESHHPSQQWWNQITLEFDILWFESASTMKQQCVDFLLLPFGVCCAGGPPPSPWSAISFFTFNLIFWADIVNLKFSNMLDSESEESRVHFWKWLYANKSLCRSLKQCICWWIRVVPLFPCLLQEESSKCATRIFESYHKEFTHAHISLWVFWVF